MKKFIYVAMSAFPMLALAASADISGIQSLADGVLRIVKTLIPVMFALVIIFFLWGIVKFFMAQASGDAKAKDNAKTLLVWGVIAIAVALSIYGLVAWLQNTLGISPTTSVPLPTVQ